MKKRILALALAGTTAFSVFGAAMSANAAWWNEDSSHINANDDAYYKHYNAAGTISWGSNENDADVLTINNTCFTVKETPTGGTYSKGTKVYVSKDVYSKMDDGEAKKYVDVLDRDVEGVDYYASEEAFAKEYGYELKDVAATTDKTKPATFKNGNTTYYVMKTGSGENVKFYAIAEAQKDSYLNQGYKAVEDARTYYVSENNLRDNVSYFEIFENKDVVAEEIGNAPYYIDGMPVAEGTNLVQHPHPANVKVVVENSYWDYDVGTDAGYTTLDATDPEDYEAVMANPVESSGEVYLYDYVEKLPTNIGADDFADAWADGELAKFMAAHHYDGTTLEPELGYTTRGLRGDVIYAWEDFLDSIDATSGTGAFDWAWWAKNTIENYAYTYYDDDIVVKVDTTNNGYDIYYVTSGNVDVYNFAQLIEDIVNMAPSAKVANAQTSELVYLMQQYAKYTEGGYVDVKPVETDDWGDLLVSLLEAPTEDDFRNASSYKRYTDVAENLVEDYTEAETALKVQMAETAMYNFITSVEDNSRMEDNGKADSTALASAIDNTYFNYDWRYGYDKYDANVYAGAIDESGVLDQNFVDKDLGGSKSPWDPEAWALYPKADYTGTGSYQYAGVETGISGVNDSYGWFYNVYTLAHDLYNGNELQGSIDVMAEALNEAVANLTPTTSARASDVLGAEEANDKLADLVETDYATAMWENRNKVNTYITDRVSNDEIGRVGSNNAEDIAELMATHLGYQRNQTTVTRTDINSVKTAQDNAKAALKALQDDEENYNAAQANALEKAIDDCQYLIDIYNGDYSKSALTQSVNTAYNGAVGDKDQIVKSDCTDAVEAVDAAINFSSIIMGWSQDKDGNWMYGTEEGYLNDGWHQVDGGKTWFYFNEDGTAKQSEWWQDGSTWYWFNSNCGAAVGWAKIDGDWYYFKGNNAMKTGWEKVEGSWYYMNSSGKMVTGWCQINGTWYYFSKESNALGQMLANTTTPDGYKVDANGALVE